MIMKKHVLAALREQFDRWEFLLAGMSDEQITAPALSDGWSIKDIIAHLFAWRTRSIARFEAATLDRAPAFPRWLPDVDSDADGTTDRVNAWIYEAYRARPWAEIHKDWRDGFLRLLELAELVTERDLLDSGRYPWLAGLPLAFILLSSYDHHQEHYEKLTAWLEQSSRGALPPVP